MLIKRYFLLSVLVLSGFLCRAFELIDVHAEQMRARTREAVIVVSFYNNTDDILYFYPKYPEKHFFIRPKERKAKEIVLTPAETESQIAGIYELMFVTQNKIYYVDFFRTENKAGQDFGLIQFDVALLHENRSIITNESSTTHIPRDSYRVNISFQGRRLRTSIIDITTVIKD